MIIILLFLFGIMIVVLMITSAKMIVEAKYEIREEEERKQKEETERFFNEFNEDIEVYIRMSEERYSMNKKGRKRKNFKKLKKC